MVHEWCVVDNWSMMDKWGMVDIWCMVDKWCGMDDWCGMHNWRRMDNGSVGVWSVSSVNVWRMANAQMNTAFGNGFFTSNGCVGLFGWLQFGDVFLSECERNHQHQYNSNLEYQNVYLLFGKHFDSTETVQLENFL